jgi:hypothetical protein
MEGRKPALGEPGPIPPWLRVLRVALLLLSIVVIVAFMLAGLALTLITISRTAQ